MEYSVKLAAFEGPLDLLLHLIQRFEIDIYNIPMAQLTEQYMLYVHAMQELELDVASEYLVMAASLLAIKSKMLLPVHHEEPVDEEFSFEEEDPRDELVEKLMEYRQFKEAAEKLKQQEEERAQLFTKIPSEYSELELPKQEAPLNVTVYDMLSAFQKMLMRKRRQAPLQTTVTRQDISIEERMDVLFNQLEFGKQYRFEELFPYEEKAEIVVTFLAVLELMKLQRITIDQSSHFADIFIARKE